MQISDYLLMKKTILFSIIIAIPAIALCQDTIVMRNNKIIPAVINEVSSTQIKYKQADMPDGPVFIVEKSEIEKIKYKNGQTETMVQVPSTVVVTQAPAKPSKGPFIVPGADFIPLEKKQTYDGKVIGDGRMYRIMDLQKDPELIAITARARKSKGRRYIGFGALPALGAAVGYTYGGIEIGEHAVVVIGGIAGAAAIALGTTGLICNIRYKKFKAKAVAFYNQKY